jgi:nucleotide-binding universal stress UspA family protein
MKILISYDGSECSDAAIVDLRRAGLPATTECMVLTVAQTVPQLATVPYTAMVGGTESFPFEGPDSETCDDFRLKDAQTEASKAAERLRADFPNWQIKTESWVDDPATAIIRKTHAWKPDLLIVGSHGRSGFRRFILGSVSQHVLNHVDCSLRISRHHLHTQERPIRLLIGVDGSENCQTAVRAVAARNWPAGTEARVVGVVDTRVSVACATTPLGAMPVDIEDECRLRMSLAVHTAAQVLSDAGLTATHQVLGGRPSDTLLAEAEKWAADSIFVGAKGMSGIERFLLGSVSTAVASKAHCSVEIVRTNAK